MSIEPGDRLKAYALAQLERAITCLAWRGARAHEGVHQARKSMRRVRACLALGESALGAGANMLDSELSKICKSLSALRDAQARVESLNRLLEHHAKSRTRTVLEFLLLAHLTALTGSNRSRKANGGYFSWLKSMVREPPQRRLLHELDMCILELRSEHGDNEQSVRLTKLLPQPYADVG